MINTVSLEADLIKIYKTIPTKQETPEETAHKVAEAIGSFLETLSIAIAVGKIQVQGTATAQANVSVLTLPAGSLSKETI